MNNDIDRMLLTINTMNCIFRNFQNRPGNQAGNFHAVGQHSNDLISDKFYGKMQDLALTGVLATNSAPDFLKTAEKADF